MKTNRYLEKYIKSQVMQNDGRDLQGTLKWVGGLNETIRIEPSHFNYFSLQLITTVPPSTLTVDDARKLANWLLDVTDGLGETHEIRDEIKKRRNL